MASESAILACPKKIDNKPWVDTSFLQLMERRKSGKDKKERYILNKEVKKHRDKIKQAVHA